MSTCNKDHRSDPYFARLPVDQGDFGRHKCAGCAYEAGYQRGINRCMSIDMEGVRLENGKYPTLRLFFVRFDIDTT